MMDLATLLLVLLAPVSENDLYENPDRIQISHQNAPILTILPSQDHWNEAGADSSQVQMSLAYRHLTDKWHMAVKPEPWKWVAEAGVPSLLVFEAADEQLSAWRLRQFLWSRLIPFYKKFDPYRTASRSFGSRNRSRAKTPKPSFEAT